MPNDTEVEQEIARLVKLAHPQDQGKPTEILEQELRTTIHTSLIKAVEGQKITNKSELKFVDSHLKTFEGGYNFALDKVLTIINSIFKE